jgi:hypothetical protein
MAGWTKGELRKIAGSDDLHISPSRLGFRLVHRGNTTFTLAETPRNAAIS